MSRILCIDLGNTNTHFGFAEITTTTATAQISHRGDVSTADIASEIGGLAEIFLKNYATLSGIAFCSVVPKATEKLRETLARCAPKIATLELTHACALGVAIDYPKPSEIGPDRLANAAGAAAIFGTPAIVIDTGTATTFDIISARNGYEGGIIAPGVDLMRSYLHERTALLPLLPVDDTAVQSHIGKSTQEAMRIGCVSGFAGMIQTLLKNLSAELAVRGEKSPTIVLTGGTAAALRQLLDTPAHFAPDITLQGLAIVWKNTHGSA